MEKKQLYNLQNTLSFFLFVFGPLLFSNLITFVFFIHFKRFKVIYERHLQIIEF
jgi:hypothetical protein